MAGKKSSKADCSGCGGNRFRASGECVTCGRMRMSEAGKRTARRADERSGRPKKK